ncbi:MAG: alkaline phosphatase [Mucinivorans sp.]
MSKITSLLLVTFALLLSAGSAQGKSPIFKHVILIASDGFSGQIVRENPGKFPNIEKLFARGSYTLEARSVLPSSSAVNWATLLMGAGPEMHGFTEWGSKSPEVEPIYTTPQYGMFPSIFSVVRAQRPKAITGALYSWDGIGYLFEKRAVDLDFLAPEDDDKIAQRATEYISQAKPNFLFVYFSEPDHTGHTYGWLSQQYITSCQKIDSLVGVVVNAIDAQLDGKSTAIIYTSDHGGVDKGHGGKSMSEMQVPYVMVGRGIAQGQKIEGVVMKYDNAPTVAKMLNLKVPEQWRGRSVL